MSQNRHARANRETGAPHEQRNVTGDISITGRVETDLSQDFFDKYRALNESADKREARRFVVEGVTLIFVIIVAIFALVQTRQSVKSANAAVTSADAAKASVDEQVSQFHLDERAWVSMEAKLDGFKFSDEGATVDLKFDMLNTGKTPAQSIKSGAILSGFQTQFAGAIQANCSGLVSQYDQEMSIATTLFPNKPFTESVSAGLSKSEVISASTNSLMAKAVILTVRTCIDYTLAFDPREHHQTGQTYVLAYKDLGRSPIGFFTDFYIGKTYPTVFLMRMGENFGN